MIVPKQKLNIEAKSRFLDHSAEHQRIYISHEEIFRVVCKRKARVGWMIGPITASPIFGQ